MRPLSATSREEIEVYRFGLAATLLVPLGALLIQSWVPVHLPFMAIFDLPFLVTIFFAVARRSQVAGMVTGGIIGLAQDALSGLPLGIYGIANTVVGYGASSLGVKIDVENPGSRLLMTMLFYCVHQVIFFLVARGLVNLAVEPRLLHEVVRAVANGLLAVVLFALLDRCKRTT